MGRLVVAALMVLLMLGTSSCSMKRMAANSVANSLTQGPDVFGRDDDPELIRDALPFGLKTMESLLEIIPEHEGLLLTACKGYTQYAYGFIQLDADIIEPQDFARAEEMRARALKLFLRGREFGLRGLELHYRHIGDSLRVRPREAAARVKEKQLPMLYWTAAAWGAAISVGKDKPELVADLAAVQALIERGIVLDEGYDRGALHEVMIVLDALPKAMGGSLERARQHFDRAVALSEGLRASPYVTFAQSVSVQEQNRREFEELLGRALAVDPDREPEQRLANLLFQKKARALLERADDLFLEAAPSDTQPSEKP